MSGIFRRWAKPTTSVGTLWSGKGGSIRWNSGCDPGKCTKQEIYMKGMLHTEDLAYLQPARKQFSTRKFVFQKPIVPAMIDYSLEESCRRIEACKKEAGKKGNKNKK